MIIDNFRSEKAGNRKRAAASVVWEDREGALRDLFFEVEETFAEDLDCNPAAFLVGGLVPAVHFGEKRIRINAPICPELREGLSTALSFLSHWYYSPDQKPIRIESCGSSRLQEAAPHRGHAGFFFTGGVDSFSTLLSNHLSHPKDHAGYLKDGLLVYGFDIDSHAAFDLVVQALRPAAEEAGINFIVASTNLYLPYRRADSLNGFKFWRFELQGAAMAAVAHAFARRLAVVSIASSMDVYSIVPWGSHPLLDCNYGSSTLRIRHEGLNLTRFARTKLVAESTWALRHLRVCNRFQSFEAGRLNCCRCEKCVRTMLALLALGVLDKATLFKAKEVTADLVHQAVLINDETVELDYLEMIAPLQDLGQHDLVREIKRKVDAYRAEKCGWKAKLRQLDNRYLHGNASRLKHLLSNGHHVPQASPTGF